ncbi:TetR/AcrR family transcriptional regulator [Gordonia rhizosphera]|uniref:TetR/AcrR family transcriptional regulator n=1 Tax=Gordonia rhizosphera TaxID=83341 RepID=UPI00030575BE|nr:TetR/AcrR family transcriptional regulator [Gordonia rhizosphera]
MPKIVDHDERRREIIAVVWRLIATRGIEAMTMRTIAEEAGYANGVLSYYFANKDEVVRRAYEHVSLATNDRVARKLGDARGLAALRILCYEIMPRTDEALLEARIAATLWERAMHDPAMRQINAQAWEDWRVQMIELLDQAVSDGEIPPSDTVLTTDTLLTLLMGMQVLAVLSPEMMPPSRQDELFENFIVELHSGA